MKIAFDTNVLIYAVVVRKVAADDRKIADIRSMIDALNERSTIVCSWQVLCETYNVMQRNGRPRDECRVAVDRWQQRFETVASSNSSYVTAVELATDHKLQIWDSLILATAVEAGCTLLLTEDMQAGFTWRGVTVANPFADPLDRTLARAMRG